MRRIKLLSVIMTGIMLMPMLMSCTKAKKNANVVKEDDPWYESTKFKLSDDLGQNSSLGGTNAICTSGDRIYYLYCFSRTMWATSKTVLDTYDYSGKMIDRKELPDSDDFRVYSIYSASADPEGKTVEAVIRLFENKKDRICFMSIDAETGKVSDLRDLLSEEAEKVKKPNSDLWDIYSVGDYSVAVFNLGFSSDSNMSFQLLLFRDAEFVAELDLSTANIRYVYDGISIDESSDSIYVAGLGGADAVTLEFDTETGKLKSKTSFLDQDDSKVNYAEYTATCDGDMCKMDSLGNIMKIDINTMTARTAIDTNWYTPYFYSLGTNERSVDSKILSCTGDRAVILDSESIDYGIDDFIRNFYITVLTKAEKNPHAGKEIIELSFPPNSGVSDYLAKSIYEFNKTDEKYLLRIWNKYKTGFTLGRAYGKTDEDAQKLYEMLQDLKGDDAPDLAIGIQINYAMRDDVFMDMTGFLEPEVLEKQYKNIIDAGKSDGKLYFMPVTIEIEGLVTNADLIDDGAVGITFDDFEKLINEDMHGFSPYDYPFSWSYNRQSFILSCIDTKSAVEGDTVDFGTEQFRAAVEYAKDKFTYDDEMSMPPDYVYDYNRNRGECYYAKINDYLDFVHACYKSKGNYKIIGTPSVDASGPRFNALETISVSATTDVEDGCRKFLNYLFSGAAFSSDPCEFRQIVTNKEIMNRNIETFTGLNNKAYEKLVAAKASGAVAMTGGAEKAYGDKMATDDMRESFLDSMSTISTCYYEDYRLVQFVFEEILPYYAGDRTLDDAIRYLNDRATKYVKEM